MHPPVQRAIEQIQANFAAHEVLWREDGSGGAWVVVEDLPLGGAFLPDGSWMGFPIPYLYPRADVYPHYVRGDLRRADGTALTVPLNPGHSMPLFNRPAVMVSRRSTRWYPGRDTALLKLLRVLHWFDQQARQAA